MKEYVEREALLKRLCDDDPSHMEDYYYNAIKNAPAADVVEVVRCKDCRHNHCMVGNSYRYCALHDTKVYADDFCSYGERKMDGKGEGG